MHVHVCVHVRVCVSGWAPATREEQEFDTEACRLPSGSHHLLTASRPCTSSLLFFDLNVLLPLTFERCAKDCRRTHMFLPASTILALLSSLSNKLTTDSWMSVKATVHHDISCQRLDLTYGQHDHSTEDGRTPICFRLSPEQSIVGLQPWNSFSTLDRAQTAPQ